MTAALLSRPEEPEKCWAPFCERAATKQTRYRCFDGDRIARHCDEHAERYAASCGDDLIEVVDLPAA